jgi:hypothetical protein
MKPTFSYLKGLAESHAELQSEITRLTRMHVDISARLIAAKAELQAAETLLVRADKHLDPSAIKPVRRSTRYGPRGALREFVETVLSDAAPEAITTFEVAVHVQQAFKLDFGTQADAAKWLHNTLGRCLKNIVIDGKAERLHDPDDRSAAVGGWRWR